MAQLLVIDAQKRHFYQPIASIRDYKESDLEHKLHKYAKELFANYYVFSFKYAIKKKSDITESYEPDLILISKKFNRWIFLEVELCKPDLSHTFRQIDCFTDPFFDADEILKFLFKHNHVLNPFKTEVINLVKNRLPELLVVFDDYNKLVFEKINAKYPNLKVCVLEVYRETGNHFDAYRLGGKYPYDVTNATKISYFDESHFVIEKMEIVDHLNDGDVEILFDMLPFNAVLTKAKRKNGKCMIKIVGHNFDKKDCLQLALDVDNKLIIQTL